MSINAEEHRSRPFRSRRSFDAVMLDAFAHRAANDTASALATLELAKLRTSDPRTTAALEEATAKLHAMADAQQILRRPPAGTIDLGQAAVRVVRQVTASRYVSNAARLVMRSERIDLPAEAGWQVLSILAELVTVHIAHAFEGTNGTVAVIVEVHEGHVVCSVCDDAAATTGTKNDDVDADIAIVDALASSAGGAIVRRAEASGSVTVFSAPLSTLLRRGLRTSRVKHRLHPDGTDRSRPIC